MAKWELYGNQRIAARVCSRHFSAQDYEIVNRYGKKPDNTQLRDSVPHLFLNSEASKKPKLVSNRQKRLARRLSQPSRSSNNAEVYQPICYSNDEEIMCTDEPKTAMKIKISGLSSPSTLSMVVQAHMYGEQLFFTALLGNKAVHYYAGL